MQNILRRCHLLIIAGSVALVGCGGQILQSPESVQGPGGDRLDAPHRRQVLNDHLTTRSWSEQANAAFIEDVGNIRTFVSVALQVSTVEGSPAEAGLSVSVYKFNLDTYEFFVDVTAFLTPSAYSFASNLSAASSTASGTGTNNLTGEPVEVQAQVDWVAEDGRGHGFSTYGQQSGQYASDTQIHYMNRTLATSTLTLTIDGVTQTYTGADLADLASGRMRETTRFPSAAEGEQVSLLPLFPLFSSEQESALSTSSRRLVGLGYFAGGTGDVFTFVRTVFARRADDDGSSGAPVREESLFIEISQQDQNGPIFYGFTSFPADAMDISRSLRFASGTGSGSITNFLTEAQLPISVDVSLGEAGPLSTSYNRYGAQTPETVEHVNSQGMGRTSESGSMALTLDGVAIPLSFASGSISAYTDRNHVVLR